MKPSVFLLWALLIPLTLSSETSKFSKDPFLWSVDLGAHVLKPGQEIPLEILFSIPPGHHLFRDKINLTLKNDEKEKNIELTPLKLSPSVRQLDPFSGKELDIYEDGALLQAFLKAKPEISPGKHVLTLELSYQGCSSTLCYRLMKKEIPLTLTVEGATPTSFDNHWLFLSLILAFLGGLGSAFTPCVLPIIPITLAFIGVRKESQGLWHNFILSLFLVLSMAFTYALLGVAAAMLGKSLGFLYQNIYFLLFGVILYITFALSLFGLFELQLPLVLRNRLAKMGGKGIAGAIVAGFTIGFLAAPCVGPLIGSLLLYVAERRNIVKGFSLLFSYGLGMGSIFLVVGTYYHRLATKVHGGPATVWIKRILAVLLLIPAFYYSSIIYGHFKKTTPEAVSSFWISDAKVGMAQAKAENKPVFVDFFATWCLPCLEMEKTTFSQKVLQDYLTTHFVPIKVDCTEETATCKEMVDQYGIVGWPTFLILNPKGEVVERYIGRGFSAKELVRELQSTRYFSK